MMAPVIFDPEAIRNHPLNYLAAFWSRENGNQNSGAVQSPVASSKFDLGLSV